MVYVSTSEQLTVLCNWIWIYSPVFWESTKIGGNAYPRILSQDTNRLSCLRVPLPRTLNLQFVVLCWCEQIYLSSIIPKQNPLYYFFFQRDHSLRQNFLLKWSVKTLRTPAIWAALITIRFSRAICHKFRAKWLRRGEIVPPPWEFIYWTTETLSDWTSTDLFFQCRAHLWKACTTVFISNIFICIPISSRLRGPWTIWFSQWSPIPFWRHPS